MAFRFKYFILSLLVIFFLSNVATTEFFQISDYPLVHADAFDPPIRTDYRELINAEKPEIIVLGDSAISRLNAENISAITGKKTLVFPAPGTGSAYWYLFIRNQLYLADHRPGYLILFFRDSTLTVPEYRVTGEYFVRLEEIASSWDADVYELAVNYRKSPLVRVLERYIPLFSYRSEIFGFFMNWCRNYGPGILLGASETKVEEAYESVFERSRFNDQMWEELLLNIDNLLYLPRTLDFNANVNRSFLPPIIRDLKSIEVYPVFVRVKYRSHARGDIDTSGISQYMADLRNYLAEKGSLFLDLSELDGLAEDMYEDNFHISAESGDLATKIIAEEIDRLLK